MIPKSGTWTYRNGYVVSTEPTGHDDDQNVNHYGGHLVCESVPNDDIGRLLAAAPDLLEACQQVAGMADCTDAADWKDAFNWLVSACVRAVAKAKGI